jgi:hypothetical protein
MKHPRLQRILSERLRALAALTLLLAVGFLAFRSALRVPPAPVHPATPLAKADILAAYGKLPIAFEKNEGQSDLRVKFLAHGNGYTLFLTDREAVLHLGASRLPKAADDKGFANGRASKSETSADSVVRLSLAGSNPSTQLEGLELQSGHTNYLIGNNPARWQRSVPLYSRVKYHDVYPGIDAVYYGNQSQLETDFVVSPGSDPGQIALQISGGEDIKRHIKLDAQGDLVVGSAAGDLILHCPDVYQEISGRRREVAANYVQRRPGLVGIQVASYDSTKPLVVDPVVVYSTYLGGSTGTAGGVAGNSANAVTVDANDNAYITGSTSASDFPVTSGVFQSTNKSNGFLKANAFVTKLNPTATALVYSTFLGGSVGDSGDGIGADSSGNAYVTGSTSSLDFPVTPGSAIQSIFPAGNTGSTGFFTVLDPNGVSLLYSTYLGGNGTFDGPAGITLDANGIAYIVGTTDSSTFPVSPNALQKNNNSGGAPGPGSDNVFLSRIDRTKAGLAGLVYSTYLGGTGSDSGSAIAVDANANAYLVGTATSSNFPMMNAFQPNLNGRQNAFIARIDTVNSVLVYSTFLGEGFANGDTGNCIAVDSNFNAYVGGHTYDLNFPVTVGAFETTFPAAANDFTGFVARFDTTKSGASSLIYATYLGGSVSGDQPHAVAVDSVGNAYLTGETWSGNFPVTPGAPQNNGVSGLQNGFLSVLSANGSLMLFSTYYGSAGASGGGAVDYGLALDSASTPDVFIVGKTTSTKYPTTSGAYDTSPRFVSGFSYGFVSRLSPAAAQGVFANPSSLAFGNQPKGTASASQTVTLTNNTQTALASIVISFTGTNPLDFSQTNNCPSTPLTLAPATSCTITVTFTPSTTSAESATLNIADSDASSPQTVTLTGTGTAPPPGVTLTPSSLNLGTLTVGTLSSAQTVTLSNNSAVAVTITSPGITITGANAADFSDTTTCPAVGSTLAAGTTCTISVSFKPSVASAESATLSVTDSDASSPQTAMLSGTGTAPVGSVTVAPTTIAFGTLNINSTSPVTKVTLTNGKATALTITSVSLAGPNASDFAAASACGASLAANTNCTISVTYTPTIVGAESATLSIVDSDSTSPQTVTLSGTGAAALPDFTISALPTSATVSTHGTVTTLITITSIAGYSSPVTLSATALPGDSTITFAQNPVTPPANGTITSMATITTSAGVFASAPTSLPRVPAPPARILIFAAFAMALLAMWKMAGRSAKRSLCRAAVAFALLSIVAMASCVGTPSTPTGTYGVQLTGAAGKAAHAFKFTLTVK